MRELETKNEDNKEIEMKALTKSLLAAAMVAMLVVGNASVAFADGGIVVAKDGARIEAPQPGVNGYRVYGPNAIVTQVPTRSDKFTGNALALDGLLLDVRTGISDIWSESRGFLDIWLVGSHNSESPLNEDEIWIDGAIKKSGQSWYDSASSHTAGYFVNVSTEMPDDFWYINTYIAHSWHHFHESGYVDWDPQTEDSMSQ